MAEVHLPLLGGVSKKALAIGGVASAAVVGLFLLRKRNAQGAAAAPADATGDGTTGTGDYVDPGLQDTSMGPTYGATGYTDPNTGQWVYGNTGTGQAAATTNAQWAQNAIAYLSQSSGTDPGTLGAALGAYLAGRAVTTDQEGLIDQAIAVEGYPPVAGAGGYPPGIRVSDSGTGAGGSAGSGGGVTGTGGTTGTGTGSGGSHPITATVSGLQVSHLYANSAQVIWHPLNVPAGQGPLTGYGVAAYDSGGRLVNGPFTVTSGQVFANIGGLKPKTAYHVNVWADPAKPGGPHATVSFTTK